MVFHRFIVFRWTGQNDSNTLRVDAILFGHGGKKISVFKKYADTCGLVLSLGLRNNMFVCRSYIKRLLDLRF